MGSTPSTSEGNMTTRAKKERKNRSFLHRHFPQVTEIVDATKAVRVTVGIEDNIKGKKNQPTECAMARAMRRDFNADGIIIGLSRSYIIKGKKAIRYQTTDTVAREIVSFDRHQDFAPGTYALSPISPSTRHGGGRASSGTHPNRLVHKQTARVRTLK